MSTVKAVAGIVPGVMAVGLLGESLKYLPSEKQLKGEGKKSSSKEQLMKPMKMVPLFVKVMVGVPLIKATAGMVGKLP